MFRTDLDVALMKNLIRIENKNTNKFRVTDGVELNDDLRENTLKKYRVFRTIDEVNKTLAERWPYES